MKLRLSAALFLIILSCNGRAQELSDRVLMTVNGQNVSAGEFIRMYKKSYEPGNLKDLDSYLEQFVVFKLKVAEAVHSGSDTTKAFRTELSGYRNQLAQNYLTDPDTKEKLLKQAYRRSLIEINAWHILVAIPPEATPEDTLKAWKKAKNIRERILQGESFEQVARSSSDDPSVKINGGNLGYFTAFQMIMPFEDMAYSLKKGELSEPVRTPYGYHIIMVAGKRPSSGKIKVAHIMISVPPGASDKTAEAAKDTIWVVYRKLISGGSFAELAAKYSDHRESASKGGELNWFGAGEIISDFAEASFKLKNNGDFTLPLKTVYGWHIIRRIDRKPPGTYEEMRPWLEGKINESYLNSISKKSFVEKLKKEYKFSVNSSNVSWFVANTDTLIIRGLAKYAGTTIPQGQVYTFAGQQLTTREFASYIEKRGSMLSTNDPAIFINRTIETCLADQITKYENSILEKKYPEFRYLMNEFHDGILLFDISGKNIWNRSQDDSTGLRKYYEENKTKYLTRGSVEGKIYLLKMKDRMKSLRTSYTKYSARSDGDEKLLSKFISKGDSLLSIKHGTWHKGDDRIVDSVAWEEGVHEITSDGMPSLVVITRVNPPEPLPFADVQSEMIPGYQEFLEKSWIRQLKEKYPVKIDKSVFEEIRKKLANE
jgi:peptidyl-prolyl cis-trans isomerase SurA